MAKEFKWCRNPETCRIIHVELEQLRTEVKRLKEALEKLDDMARRRCWANDIRVICLNALKPQPRMKP